MPVPAGGWPQLLLDNFPFMVWLKDTDSRFLAANLRVAQAAGAASTSQLRGRTDLDFFPADLAEAYRADDREVMGSRRIKQVEEEIAQGGQRRWHETYKAPLESGGVLLGTMGFAREIHGRKTMELELRESETRHRQILDNVSDLLCLAEVEEGGRCRILELSVSVERLTGISRMRLVGRHVDDLVGEGSPLLAPLARCIAEGCTVETEFLLPLHGPARTMQITMVPVRDLTNRVHRVLAVGRDITLQKRHHDLLEDRARLQSRLKRLAEVAPGVVGTYRVGPDGRASIPPPSPKLQEITGCDPESVREDAWQFARLIHADDALGWRDSLALSAAGMTPWHHEFRMHHPDKGEIWLEGRAIPEALPDGAIEWYGFLHDVTERKRAEAALRAGEGQLRELASRRDHELEVERKRLARELHDELGQSLTAVRMRAALLRVEYGDAHPRIAESVAEITKLVDRAVAAIRDAASALRPPALDMGVTAALEWLVEEFSRHSGIPCTLAADDEEAVLDDEAATSVFRIVQESLTNVARHAQAGRAEVVLRRTGASWLLRVRDDGRGFAPLAARGHLGLVGVRERVLALGGELSVQSAPDSGTLLEVRFPAVRGAP